MESNGSRRSLIVILALVIIAVLALLAAVISSQNNTNQNNNDVNSGTQLNLIEYCESNNGTWIDETKECEGLSEAMCTAREGVFNECASACRNNPEQDVCTLQCVIVCDFDQDSEITVQVQNGDNIMELSLSPVENENAFDFMTRLEETNPEFTFEYSDSSFGKFVTAINGIEADSTKQFWELNVNGSPAAVGISDLVLQPGDIVAWKLVEFSADFQ
jgi:antitoxin component of MazEF toxin-antitoxin module